MSSNSADKATTGGGDVEDSETMVEIKIKTLDSQTYTLRVNKFLPVPLLKEQIANVTGVLSEQQRLICRGRVLKDDTLLSEYHVEDGHTLHMVVRQPNPSGSTSEGPSVHQDSSSAPGNAQDHRSSIAHSFVFESVNVDQGDIDTSIVSRIISSMLDTIGSTGSRTGSTTMTASDSVFSDPRQPQLNPANPQSLSSRRQADFVTPSSVPLVPQNPPVIPDSLTTLNQYISYMKDAFRRQGISSSVSEQIDGQSQESHSHGVQGGLPSPTSLAEILLSTRRLLMEQTGECLSQLATQLEGHTSITDSRARTSMQTGAIRSGILMRDLGSLLLELGRTTMTLRMGQTPAEAIVNAGPANFISATGPAPLMVQPVPFYPGPNVSGTHMGPASYGHGQAGEQPDPPSIPTRNIEIRIRTAGRAIPVVTSGADAGLTAGQQQQQEQTEPARSSSHANAAHQAFAGGEPRVRVVPMPLRTVVAVPSGVDPSQSDPFAGSVRLLYPQLARVRPQATDNPNGSSVSGSNLWESVHQYISQGENLESNSEGAARNSGRVPANTRPFGSGLNPPVNDPAASQGTSHVSSSSQQSAPNNDINGSNPASVPEEGVFLSNVLRQIMPLITVGREQGVSTTNPSSSTAEIVRENLDGSSSSQHHRDPPESPNAKRMKRNSE